MFLKNVHFVIFAIDFLSSVTKDQLKTPFFGVLFWKRHFDIVKGISRSDIDHTAGRISAAKRTTFHLKNYVVSCMPF
jgi:hypothetical protein